MEWNSSFVMVNTGHNDSCIVVILRCKDCFVMVILDARGDVMTAVQ